MDAAACLTAFSAAIAGDYAYQAAAAISVRGGVKLSGSNIAKVYHLFDSAKDAVVTGVIERDTVKEVWATAKFDSVGEIITLTGLTVNRTGKFGFMASTCDHASVNNGLFPSFAPAAQLWTLGEYDSVVTIGGVTKIDADTFIPDNGANGVLVEQDGGGGCLGIYRDGVQMDRYPLLRAVGKRRCGGLHD